MSEQKMQEKFVKLAKDEDFVIKLMTTETPEAAQALLAGQGIELSVDEVTTMVKAIGNYSTSGELAEDQLSEVSGGLLMEVLGGIAAFGAALKASEYIGKKIGEAIVWWKYRR